MMTRTIFGEPSAAADQASLGARLKRMNAGIQKARRLRRVRVQRNTTSVTSSDRELGGQVEFGGFPEGKAIAFEENLHVTAAGEFALNQVFGEGVLDISLDGPAKRPRPIGALPRSRLQEPLVGFRGKRNLEIARFQGFVEPFDHQCAYLQQVIFIQRVENDDFIDPVEELGTER